MQTTRKGSCNEQQDDVRLVFVGSPLLDITAECGPELIKKYGLLLDDCLTATSKHDDLFRQLFDDPESRLDAGGSALNSARIAKWALGKQGKVAFAGSVGDDEYAARLECELLRSGVEPLLVTLPGRTTGLCACLLSPDGQRSMVTSHRASSLFSESHLEERGIGKWIRTAHCIFVVGYFIAHSPDVVQALSEMVLPGQLFALSLSAGYICRDYKDTLLKILPKVDILFGNRNEVQEFAAANGWKTVHTEEIAYKIAAIMGRRHDRSAIVVVTQGPYHVIYVRGDKPVRYFPVPDIGKSLLDSVGCGDALAGAFLGVYQLTGDASRAVQAGIKAAVEIAQVPGCCPPAKKLVY